MFDNELNIQTNTLTNILENAPKELMVQDAFTKSYSVFQAHKKICVSISGGSDSDILVDMATKLDPDQSKTTFVFFDTGIEMAASKQHIAYLEDRYGIKIEIVRPKMPVPLAVREKGFPFLSKYCSEMIHRLQINNFDFKRGNRSYEELLSEYPNCQSALAWWCNLKISPALRVDGRKYLKEFLIANPPKFKIASACCHEAKIKTSEEYLKKGGFDLSIIGVRRAEGGIRSAKSNCFISKGLDKPYDTYKMIFWFTNTDKKRYEEFYNITHSKAYTEYLLPRTGCAACSYGNFEEELKILDIFEPNLAKAARNIFGQSYDYTREYFAFRDSMTQIERNNNEEIKEKRATRVKVA